MERHFNLGDKVRVRRGQAYAGASFIVTSITKAIFERTYVVWGGPIPYAEEAVEHDPVTDPIGIQLGGVMR